MNYSTPDKEILAIVLGSDEESCGSEIRSLEIENVHDDRTTAGYRRQRNSMPWAEELSAYDFKIEHKKTG